MMKYKGTFIKLFPLMLKKHMIGQYGKKSYLEEEKCSGMYL